jgi:hypothetical protein
MNYQLQKILERKLTRKEFFLVCGIGLASVAGVTAAIRALQIQADTSLTASFEPETAATSGNVTITQDPTASGGSAVQFGQVTTTPPDPTPTGWQQAVNASVAQQTTAAIRTWYENNTGHTALGWVEATPGPGQRKLVAGSLVSTHDGQVIEGIVGSYIRVSHDNVTIRGCRVNGGSTYGAFLNPTFGAPVTGLRIEHCTLHFGQVATQTFTRAGVFMHPAQTTNPGFDVVFSHCDVNDWSDGFVVRNKTLVEYCWVHDLQHPPLIHSSSIRAAFDGGKLYRNYCTDGTSGCISIYFDKEATHNITVEENIMSGESPLATPSYLCNMKDGAYAAGATNIKWLNNWWYTGYQYGIVAGGRDVPWGSNGNERTGNRWLMTGELMGNQ